ncbi:MAG: hypothetical protein BWX98_02555 [Candidatus Aminicenantes bacterium ADurb.Bin147]|nr:MAG: hypothetical protein BWX98_02555 [Candidatus Aminicenantes bacterium ADurb.Bin147]
MPAVVGDDVENLGPDLDGQPGHIGQGQSLQVSRGVDRIEDSFHRGKGMSSGARDPPPSRFSVTHPAHNVLLTKDYYNMNSGRLEIGKQA